MGLLMDKNHFIYLPNSGNVIRSATTVRRNCLLGRRRWRYYLRNWCQCNYGYQSSATNVHGIGISIINCILRHRRLPSGWQLLIGPANSGGANARIYPGSPPLHQTLIHLYFWILMGIAGPDIGVYVASSAIAPTGIVKIHFNWPELPGHQKVPVGLAFGVTAVYNNCTGNASVCI